MNKKVKLESYPFRVVTAVFYFIWRIFCYTRHISSIFLGIISLVIVSGTALYFCEPRTVATSHKLQTLTPKMDEPNIKTSQQVEVNSLQQKVPKEPIESSNWRKWGNNIILSFEAFTALGLTRYGPQTVWGRLLLMCDSILGMILFGLIVWLASKAVPDTLAWTHRAAWVDRKNNN